MVTAHRTAQACNCSQLHPLCAHSFSVTLTSSLSATTRAASATTRAAHYRLLTLCPAAC